MEGRFIGVVAALQREEADVIELDASVIALVDLGDGHQRVDVEAVVERDGGVVGWCASALKACAIETASPPREWPTSAMRSRSTRPANG